MNNEQVMRKIKKTQLKDKRIIQCRQKINFNFKITK